MLGVSVPEHTGAPPGTRQHSSSWWPGPEREDSVVWGVVWNTHSDIIEAGYRHRLCPLFSQTPVTKLPTLVSTQHLEVASRSRRREASLRATLVLLPSHLAGAGGRGGRSGVQGSARPGGHPMRGLCSAGVPRGDSRWTREDIPQLSTRPSLKPAPCPAASPVALGLSRALATRRGFC